VAVKEVVVHVGSDVMDGYRSVAALVEQLNGMIDGDHALGVGADVGVLLAVLNNIMDIRLDSLQIGQLLVVWESVDQIGIPDGSMIGVIAP